MLSIIRALTLYCSLVIFLAVIVTAKDTDGNRPLNIVLILTDDMGWMDLRCQGNNKLHTPHIDALAKQGVRFTDAYAASPVCTPTRASLMTGKAPARLNILQHGADQATFWPKDRKIQPPEIQHILPLEEITLAERLKGIGYATGHFGKWHLSGTRVDKNDPKTGGVAFYPDRQGFDVNIGGCGKGGPPTYFDPYRIPTLKPRQEGEYLSDRLADEAVQWMRANHQKPMFLSFWMYNPHWPFEAPADLIEKYKGKEGPGLINPVYGAQIEATDKAVGRVLDELEKLGIVENTLVIFTSDNGGWSGATDNTPLKKGKGYLYEGGVRVPLIIRWPGVASLGKIESMPVVSMDLTATILDAVGIKLDRSESLDGRSLQPLLKGEKVAHEPVCIHYPHWSFHKDNQPGSSIRDGKYKLILRYGDDSSELYNLETDLGEKKNLAQEFPVVTEKLRGKLKSWLKKMNAQQPKRLK